MKKGKIDITDLVLDDRVHKIYIEKNKLSIFFLKEKIKFKEISNLLNEYSNFFEVQLLEPYNAEFPNNVFELCFDLK